MTVFSYIGYPIPEHIRKDLLENNHEFRPAYKDILAHHITLVPPNIYSKMEKSIKKSYEASDLQFAGIILYATVDDGKGCQVVLARVNNTTNRPDGGIYHCTWSIDRSKGYKPVDSNRVINEYPKHLLENPINIWTKPKLF